MDPIIARLQPPPSGPPGPRLLFLAPHPFFQERGTPIADLAVIEALTRRGCEVDLLTFHEGESVSVPGCTVHRIPPLPGVRDVPPGFSGKAVVCDIALAAAAWRLARKHDYRVIHAVEESVFVAMTLQRLYGIPYVYDMDSSLPEQMAACSRVFRPFVSWMKRLEALAIHNATGVLTMCRSLEKRARSFAPHIPIQRAEDVPIRTNGEGSERIADTIGASGPIVLYVGNLMPYQGIDLLVESFRVASRAHAHARLVLIGGSADRRRHYARRLRQLDLDGRVHLLGPRPLDELGWYLRQATVLVSARNRGENTPMKIYSYMASGVPILATRLPTHTQVLDDEVAVLCEPTPDAMSEGLSRLLSSPDLRQRISRGAEHLVNTEFNREAFEDKVNSFYDRVEASLTADPAV